MKHNLFEWKATDFCNLNSRADRKPFPPKQDSAAKEQQKIVKTQHLAPMLKMSQKKSEGKKKFLPRTPFSKNRSNKLQKRSFSKSIKKITFWLNFESS